LGLLFPTSPNGAIHQTIGRKPNEILKDAKGFTLRTDESAPWACYSLQSPKGAIHQIIGRKPDEILKDAKGSTLRIDESARWACYSLQDPKGRFTKPSGASPMNQPQKKPQL
jgi:hypothetical protein